MSNVFYYCSRLKDISALANWDTSNVTDMSEMFDYTSITDISALLRIGLCIAYRTGQTTLLVEPLDW